MVWLRRIEAESAGGESASFECSIELLEKQPLIICQSKVISPEDFATSSGDRRAAYCAGYIRGMTDRMAGHELAMLSRRVKLLGKGS